MNTEDQTYNGYANYETWNVALWIQNDEGLYNIALGCKRKINPYQAFCEMLQEFGGNIHTNTPDGVPWLSPDVDQNEINSMFEELNT